MSKKTIPLKTGNKQRPVEKKPVNKKAETLRWFTSNVLGFIVTLALITGVILKQDDYYWVKDMLQSNHSYIVSNDTLSIRERLGAKLGVSYNLYDSIRTQTPDTAIIYIPDKAAFFPPGVTSIFEGEPYNKLWAIRFLYPRKVVTPLEMNKTSYAEKITHVTIIYGKGIELLRYKLPAPLEFGILFRDSLRLIKN